MDTALAPSHHSAQAKNSQVLYTFTPCLRLSTSRADLTLSWQNLTRKSFLACYHSVNEYSPGNFPGFPWSSLHGQHQYPAALSGQGLLRHTRKVAHQVCHSLSQQHRHGGLAFGKARSDLLHLQEGVGCYSTVPGTSHRFSHGSHQPLGPGSKNMRQEGFCSAQMQYSIPCAFPISPKGS